jgi:DNA repair exonuclease SbcCD ATPase subunit
VDKKIKKKIDKLRQQIQQLRNRLAGARKQDDEPGEVARLESEIAAAQKQLDELQAN